MIRINPVRWTQRSVEAGTDQVIFAVNVPEGSIVNSVDLKVNQIKSSRQTIGTALVTALHGYLLPIPDVPGEDGPDQLWDQIVPKDTALQADDGGSENTGLDEELLDTDTRPHFEIGETHLDVTKVLGITGSDIDRIYKRVMLHTFAKTHAGYDKATETYIPTEQYKVSLNGSIRAEVDSILAFGFSSPEGLDTETTWPMLTDQTDWYRLRFVKTLVEQAAVQVLGLSDSHDWEHEPFYGAANVLSDYLEWVYEEDGSSFGSGTWQVFTEGSAWISVEGEMNTDGAITAQS